MNKETWIKRYIKYIGHATKCGIEHGKYLAEVHIDENDDPEDCAQGEIECWD